MQKENFKKIVFFISFIIVIASFVYGLNVHPVAVGNPNLYDVEHFSINFESYEELSDFIQNLSIKGNEAYSYYDLATSPIVRSDYTIETLNGESNHISDLIIKDYSQTNIEVTGVDEPDIVKTDGKYLYVLSYDKIYIINALPAEKAEILSEVKVNSSTQISNIFVIENKLVILGQKKHYPIITHENIVRVIPKPCSYDTYIKIYDISNINNPELVKDVIVSGYLFGARLVDNYLYLVTAIYPYSRIIDDPLKNKNSGPALTNIIVDGEINCINLTNIFKLNDDSSTVTSIMSLNLDDLNEDINTKVYFLKGLQLMYVSEKNIYLSYSSEAYNYNDLKDLFYDMIYEHLPSYLREEIDIVYSLSLDDYQKSTIVQWLIKNYSSSIDNVLMKDLSLKFLSIIDRTNIYRFEIDKGEIEFKAEGSVPGSVNKEFSLSEYNANLRISTTMDSWRVTSIFPSIESQNNVYVLNKDLEIIGKIEGLAPGEDIYATRFLKDKCYLVTYKQIDPFYVIDISNPYEPSLLGELKIPGYSSYLHPFDNNHIIGVGKEGSNVKLCLFDVTDLSKPKEISKYEINNQNYYSNSYAIHDHKAFLFDPAKNLLVIPVGTYQKQSAYVFNISTNKGIISKGIISHNSSIINDNLTTDKYIVNHDFSIKRSIYIDNVLFTISNSMVKLNSLSDLKELNNIYLNQYRQP